MVLAWLMMRWLAPFPITPLVSFSWVEGQPSTPAQNPVPQAIYSRQPIYRPEWVKQSLTRRGIVLITIDPKTCIYRRANASKYGQRTTRPRCSKGIFKVALQAWQRAAAQDAD